MPSTVDRGEIMHLAGRRRLSPAVRAGVPSLVPVPETAGRCGWAAFFAALEGRRLRVQWTPDGESLEIAART
jgi:hypothetical protein